MLMFVLFPFIISYIQWAQSLECYSSQGAVFDDGEHELTLPTETCNGRCYIRSNQQTDEVITRGCTDQSTDLPGAGCYVFLADTWCLCEEDRCNYGSTGWGKYNSSHVQIAGQGRNSIIQQGRRKRNSLKHTLRDPFAEDTATVPGTEQRDPDIERQQAVDNLGIGIIKNDGNATEKFSIDANAELATDWPGVELHMGKLPETNIFRDEKFSLKEESPSRTKRKEKRYGSIFTKDGRIVHDRDYQTDEWNQQYNEEWRKSSVNQQRERTNQRYGQQDNQQRDRTNQRYGQQDNNEWRNPSGSQRQFQTPQTQHNYEQQTLNDWRKPSGIPKQFPVEKPRQEYNSENSHTWRQSSGNKKQTQESKPWRKYGQSSFQTGKNAFDNHSSRFSGTGRNSKAQKNSHHEDTELHINYGRTQSPIENYDMTKSEQLESWEADGSTIKVDDSFWDFSALVDSPEKDHTQKSQKLLKTNGNKPTTKRPLYVQTTTSVKKQKNTVNNNNKRKENEPEAATTEKKSYTKGFFYKSPGVKNLSATKKPQVIRTTTKGFPKITTKEPSTTAPNTTVKARTTVAATITTKSPTTTVQSTAVNTSPKARSSTIPPTTTTATTTTVLPTTVKILKLAKAERHKSALSKDEQIWKKTTENRIQDCGKQSGKACTNQPLRTLTQDLKTAGKGLTATTIKSVLQTALHLNISTLSVVGNGTRSNTSNGLGQSDGYTALSHSQKTHTLLSILIPIPIGVLTWLFPVYFFESLGFV